MKNNVLSWRLFLLSLVFLPVLFLPAAGVPTVDIHPIEFTPTGTIYIDMTDIQDGVDFSITITSTNLYSLADQAWYNLTDFTMPFSLLGGSLTATAENIDYLTLIVKNNTDDNNYSKSWGSGTGSVSVNANRDITAGSYDISVFGDVNSRASPVVLDIQMSGEKQGGPSNPTLSFTIKGATSGTILINVMVDGVSYPQTITIKTPTVRPSGSGGGPSSGGAPSGPSFVPPGQSALPADWYSCCIAGSWTNMTADGRQLISVNLQASGDAVAIFTNRIVTQNAKKFIITVTSEEILVPQEGNVTGTVKSANIKFDQIEGELDAIGGKFLVTLESTYPEVPPCPSGIKITLGEPPTGDLLTSFQSAAYRQGLEIAHFAYTVNFRTLNISPSNPVNLTLSVSPEWLSTVGGRNSIRIIRVTDEGIGQILDTKIVGNDKIGNTAFAAASPDGFSTFGLASLRPAAVIPPLPTIPTIVPRTTAMPTVKVTTNVTAAQAPGEETPFLFIAAAIVVLVIAVGANLYFLRQR